MSEEQATRIRRPSSSINVSDVANELDKASLVHRKAGAFDELCQKGLVKPGMIVTFAQRFLPNINLSHEPTGIEQKYRSTLVRGIVIKSISGKLAVFTILGNVEANNELSFIGRFGRVNYTSTLNNIIAPEVSNFLSGSRVSVLTDEEYVYCFNKSLFFANYLRYLQKSEGLQVLFLNNSKAILKGFDVCNLLDKYNYCVTYGVSGDVAICIEPHNIPCSLKLCKPVKVHDAFSYEFSPYSKYLELG